MEGSSSSFLLHLQLRVIQVAATAACVIMATTEIKAREMLHKQILSVMRQWTHLREQIDEGG